MCSSPHWQVGQRWFREKLSPANREQRLSRWADFAKNCLPRIGSKVLPRFREKYHALGRQKNGVQHATAIYPIPRYTRPRYIGLTLYLINTYIILCKCIAKFIEFLFAEDKDMAITISTLVIMLDMSSYKYDLWHDTIILNLGNIPLTSFHHNSDFVLLSFEFCWSDHYKILHMAWQHSCHGDLLDRYGIKTI